MILTNTYLIVLLVIQISSLIRLCIRIDCHILITDNCVDFCVQANVCDCVCVCDDGNLMKLFFFNFLSPLNDSLFNWQINIALM